MSLSTIQNVCSFAQVLGKSLVKVIREIHLCVTKEMALKKVDRSGIFSSDGLRKKVAAAVFMVATLFFSYIKFKLIHMSKHNGMVPCTCKTLVHLLSFSFWRFLLHYDNCYNLLWPLEEARSAQHISNYRQVPHLLLSRH